MKTKSIFNDFTNLYSTQKTLRFALKPVGKTQDIIDNKTLIAVDAQRAEDYQQAKQIIDEYHKAFIHHTLSRFQFDPEALQSFEQVYQALKQDKKNEALQNNLATEQDRLRKTVAGAFKTSDLFKKEFIQQTLPTWLKENPLTLEGIDEPEKIIKAFEKWTTYFGGFNENRKNIYTSAAHSTAISYRLVHENLPKFIDNIGRYKKAKDLRVDFSTIEERFKITLDDLFQLNTFNHCLTQKGIDHYNQIRGGQGKFIDVKEQGINEAIHLHAQQIKSQAKKAEDEKKKELTQKAQNVHSCKLEELYKQILSDRSELSFRLQAIENDGELCHQIQHLFSFNQAGQLIGRQEHTDRETGEITEHDFNITETLEEILEHIADADLEKLYIKNGTALTDISQSLFGNWSLIKDSLEYYAEHEKLGKKKNGEPKKLTGNERKTWLNTTAYFSFTEIHQALEKYFGRFTAEELQAETHGREDGSGITPEMQKTAESQPLFVYFQKLAIRKKNEASNTFEAVALLDNITAKHTPAEEVLTRYIEIKDEQLKNKKTDVGKIKDYLDAIMELLHFLKPLNIVLSKKDEKKAEAYEKDSGFYSEFDALYQILGQIVPLYNQARNYLTKKPYSTEKFKLNFDHQTLLGGFVDSHTASDNATQYGAYLLRKRYTQSQFKNDQFAYEYFLGISKDPKLFRCHLKEDIKDDSKHERLEYYQSKSTTFFSDKYTQNKEELLNIVKKKLSISFDNIKKESTKGNEKENKNLENAKEKLFKKETPTALFNAIRKLTEIKNNTKEYDEFANKIVEIKKILSDREVVAKCNETIKEIQCFIKKYQDRNPELAKTEQNCYSGCDGLEKLVTIIVEIAKNNKFFSFFPVSQAEFDEVKNRQEKPLYLFKIVNKDLMYYDGVIQGIRKESQSTKNLHTLYFEHLFSCKQSVIDIGTGEVFYRKKNPFYKAVVHKKGTPIICKTYQEKDGSLKTIPAKEYSELSDCYTGNKKETDLSAEAKKLKSIVQVKTFDYDIVKNKRYTEDKFLLHLSIKLNFSKPEKYSECNDKINAFLKDNPDVNIIGIDRGERHLAYYTLINQQGEILKQGSFNNPQGKKDYHELLDKREKERDKARKSWGTIEKIKDLKAGYLSQVVHVIAKMVVEDNAIVVFEDLNVGFKKGRFKVEKQIYQKLEKMLIDKLNYLVFKDREADTAGGVLNALQLTAPFQSFQKMGKQTGIIYYVPAYHTSKVCPATGFVNLLYPRYETIKKSQTFFSSFDKISYNKPEEHFEFAFDYKNFTNKAEGSQQKWTVCSHGTRLENFRNAQQNNQWDSREINLTDDLKTLFEEQGKEQGIDFKDGQDIKESIKNQTDATFFKALTRLLRLTLQMRNSRINSEEDWMISPVRDQHGAFFDSKNAGANRPENADANGAYHIALKGRWCLEQLKTWEKGEKNHKDKDGKPTELHLAISNKDWYQFVQKKSYQD